MPRNWVAHPELAVLAKFAEIDVKSVWVGKEYGVIAPRLPEAVKDFLSDKHSEFSWTAGIIAETLWRAAGLAEEKGRGGRGDDEDRAHTSWQGAWLRAADKSAMFLSSMQLTEMGYAVRSYGLGWIRVMVPEESAADLIKDGLSIGLIPQLVDVPEGAFSMSRAVPWGGDQRSQFLAQMTAAGNRTMLWNLDKLPLLDKAERNSMLQGLIQASRRGKL